MKKGKLKLIKQGLSITIVATTLVMSGCNNSCVDKYYIVTDKGQNYICKRVGPFSNTHDYEYYDIKKNKLIGAECTRWGRNFDYNIHRAGTSFLNELQVIPLNEALVDENIDANLFHNENDINNLITNQLLVDIVNNHFVREHYYLTEKFNYISSSKLQMFVHDTDVIVGYDVSPDRDFNKYRYIYSIEDMDVKEFDRNAIVESVNIGMYLTAKHYKNNYITYNEAIDMIKLYKKNHHQKVKKIY